MKKLVSILLIITFTAVMLSTVAVNAVDSLDADTAITETESTDSENEGSAIGVKAAAAGIAVGIAASCGALAMALASYKASDGIARQPEAAGDIRSSMMLSLVFIETAIIYALIVAILIIFVL